MRRGLGGRRGRCGRRGRWGRWAAGDRRRSKQGVNSGRATVSGPRAATRPTWRLIHCCNTEICSNTEYVQSNRCNTELNETKNCNAGVANTTPASIIFVKTKMATAEITKSDFEKCENRPETGTTAGVHFARVAVCDFSSARAEPIMWACVAFEIVVCMPIPTCNNSAS